MAFSDLREFMALLEERGLLKRVSVEVDPFLEITEIVDRLVKSGGCAVLFENVKGYDVPVLANLFGSMERICLALGVDDLDDVGRRIEELLRFDVPGGLRGGLRMLSRLREFAGFKPRIVKTGPCKEVVLRGGDASLDRFPILTCWPGDGGPFITLPVVFTKNPRTGRQNVGMYRMQKFDSSTTGMHWQIHKHGARDFEDAEERLEVAVVIGADPVVVYAATAPLPEGFDEIFFAGFLRGKGVDLVKCESVDLFVPAGSEIVLEGYVEVGETRMEGPFGDHTGYYSLPDLYPVFHITCITHRRSPIYHATVVGRPPMEDAYLGKATERIFLPILRAHFPEIVDMNLPVEGVFHNLAIVSIDKRYPGHARKVMLGLWGLGQMSFTKVLIVVDRDVNVHDISEVLWAVTTRIDPARDVILIPNTPTDTLDHASSIPNLGSKMGIDATIKREDEGFMREWPSVLTMREDIKKWWMKNGVIMDCRPFIFLPHLLRAGA
ncbi:3-octaprenyl-4-hydroxybenzoate carboxy-lyase [Candidatus Methanoperedenaceae archaeon GB50]|nr:3-octaprenyl-4-hydroxybenzoate carboxy-lyase [Candidatus Methanoperedenaceae archaeon GB50]